MSPAVLTLVSQSPETTRDLGREIGLRVGPGAIIALYGDLGSGKTVLVQGLARGLGVPENYYVTSPTYTLINEYPGRCPLYHIDLYRLDAGVGFADIGLDDALYGGGVAAVEWAERCSEGAFSDYLAVYLETAGEDRRGIRLMAHGPGMVKLVNDLEHVFKEK
jgi:tRNA threonylcarbamoyladenosine biosynthesis protein TsaE